MSSNSCWFVKITNQSTTKKHLLLHVEKKQQHPSFSRHTKMTIMKYALIPHFHFPPSCAVAQSIFDSPQKIVIFCWLAGDFPFFWQKTIED